MFIHLENRCLAFVYVSMPGNTPQAILISTWTWHKNKAIFKTFLILELDFIRWSFLPETPFINKYQWLENVGICFVYVGGRLWYLAPYIVFTSPILATVKENLVIHKDSSYLERSEVFITTFRLLCILFFMHISICIYNDLFKYVLCISLYSRTDKPSKDNVKSS